MKATVITTPRFHLRLFDYRDVDNLTALYTDPEVMRYFPREYSREKAAKDIHDLNQQYKNSGFTLWAAESRLTGEFVGRIGLWCLDTTEEVELGYMVLRDHWGEGIATEVSEACLEYAFTNLQLPFVAGIAVPENTASIRVMEKLGFEFIREDCYYDTDVLYHRLEASDFHQRN